MLGTQRHYYMMRHINICIYVYIYLTYQDTYIWHRELHIDKVRVGRLTTTWSSISGYIEVLNPISRLSFVHLMILTRRLPQILRALFHEAQSPTKWYVFDCSYWCWSMPHRLRLPLVWKNEKWILGMDIPIRPTLCTGGKCLGLGMCERGTYWWVSCCMLILGMPCNCYLGHAWVHWADEVCSFENNGIGWGPPLVLVFMEDYTTSVLVCCPISHLLGSFGRILNSSHVGHTWITRLLTTRHLMITHA